MNRSSSKCSRNARKHKKQLHRYGVHQPWRSSPWRSSSPRSTTLRVCVCVCVCICIGCLLYLTPTEAFWSCVRWHHSLQKPRKIRTLFSVLYPSILDLSRCEFKTVVSESVRLPRIMCDSRHLDHSWHVQLYVLLKWSWRCGADATATCGGGRGCQSRRVGYSLAIALSHFSSLNFQRKCVFILFFWGLATLLLCFFSLGHDQFGSECSGSVLVLQGFGQFGSECSGSVLVLLGFGQFGSEYSGSVLVLPGFGQFGSECLCQCSCTARVRSIW